MLLPNLTKWVVRRVSYKKQELLTFPEYLGSRPFSCGSMLLILCWFCFVFILFVYTMLPVFLDCLRPVCVHNVASVSGLSSSCVCTQCCQCFWVVFVLFVYTMLPVFLGCLRPVCVHNVASVSGLSIIDCPFVVF
jgi:hypothetical protein